jgi:hypothetical protein
MDRYRGRFFGASIGEVENAMGMTCQKVNYINNPEGLLQMICRGVSDWDWLRDYSLLAPLLIAHHLVFQRN